MRRKSIWILVALVLLGGTVVYLVTRADPNQREAERLARKAALVQPNKPEPQDDGVDFEALVRAGQGQPLPEHLEVHPGPSKDYWFVGSQSIESGVEIPFAPGRLRTAPPKMEALKGNPGFVGAQACQKCHQQRHASFIHTAHHQTSQLATSETVHGSFQDGHNRMRTSDPNVGYTMLERGGQLFQRVSFHGWQFEVPFDLITGSSKMAQTYLYWHRDQLFQMNVTYLSSLNRWINSPGYIDGDAAYARPIPVRCLECHTTYVELREPPNHYTPNTLILGISCERCHGLGSDHVEYHTANPETQVSKFVTVPSKLSRQQQLDNCGQCHNGTTELKGDAFQFRPGDRLSDHYHPSDDAGESNSVHTSNQFARMSASECFKQSQMTCTSCHDPHQNERGKMNVFSRRCLECHESEHCGMSAAVGAGVTDNCVDCHMPKRPGDFLKLHTAGGTVFPPLRDHYIRIDDQATQAFLKSR